MLRDVSIGEWTTKCAEYVINYICKIAHHNQFKFVVSAFDDTKFHVLYSGFQ